MDEQRASGQLANASRTQEAMRLRMDAVPVPAGRVDKQVSLVNQAIEEQQKNLAEMWQTISVLADRLRPVLENKSATDAKNAKVAEPYNISDRIMTNAYTVRTMTGHLMDLINRLQV